MCSFKHDSRSPLSIDTVKPPHSDSESSIGTANLPSEAEAASVLPISPRATPSMSPFVSAFSNSISPRSSPRYLIEG